MTRMTTSLTPSPLVRLIAATTLLSASALVGAASHASANPSPPSFFNYASQPTPPVEPRLGATPDVVTAFGLDRSPGLFRARPPTPDLPRFAGYEPSTAFPRTPYIPELFGAEPCPERGPGYFRVKDTQACIAVRGRIGVGVQVGGRGQSGSFTYGRIQANVVTPTEIGDVTLSMGVQGAMSSNSNVGPIYMGPRFQRFP